ncbi:MAG TPA: ATP-dependent DNA helicase RecQ, partial [Candidatus Binatia bacterium]|nr:ATP-dependent DNA helicase RecQ [Candidatus Binatia bacterium]
MDENDFQPGSTIAETLERLGYLEFREGQEEAIRHLLAGENVLVVLPTGSGKSLIYQIAALHKPGVSIVLSPLIALMQDQVDKLEAQKIAATFINSTLSDEEEATRLERMKEGVYKIVYVAPERLRQNAFREQVRHVDVCLLAVDEAHSVSEWGHDFRTDYLHIGEFRRFIDNPPTVALTATATERVKDEIVAALGLSGARRVGGSFDRPNIKFSVEKVDDADDVDRAKLEAIQQIFNRRNSEAAIVYVGTRKNAEEVAAYLRDEVGANAEHYHAGLASGRRADVQEAFIEGELPVVVATNAFGQGIDRSDVRLVLHHSMPASLAEYYQEAGRAGRDGKSAEAILLYSKDDRRLHDYFISQSDYDYDELERLYMTLSEERHHNEVDGRKVVADMKGVAREVHLGGQGVRMRVALQHLEEAGVVEPGLYDGEDQELVLKEWDEDAVRKIVRKVEAYTEQKVGQLEEMIAYAENTLECRRALLLEYFGDEAPDAVRSDCCDVCQAKCEVAEFVAEIEEEREAADESEANEPPPALVDTILDCVQAF